jgi:hypothetical protein
MVRNKPVLLSTSGSQPIPDQMQDLVWRILAKNDLKHRDTCTATDLESTFPQIIALSDQKLDLVRENNVAPFKGLIHRFDKFIQLDNISSASSIT